jgi:hypothetical protein
MPDKAQGSSAKQDSIYCKFSIICKRILLKLTKAKVM